MSRSQRCAILAMVALWAAGAGSALAQDTERSFNLATTQPDSLLLAQKEAVEAERFVPAIRAGKLECSFTLGYLDLNQTLLAGSQLIYKITDEAVWWGDVELVGKSAFNPIFRLNYNLTHWFALEPQFSFSVCQYQSVITNRRMLELGSSDAEVQLDPPLGEFDAEHRSAVSLAGGLNTVLYPLDIVSGGQGRWHPFLLGGVGLVSFDLNSSYTSHAASHEIFSGGGGLRFIADKMISLRLEMVYSSTKIQFDAAKAFDEFNEGTLIIPVYEFSTGAAVPVDRFAAQTINSLAWALGFTASF